MQPSGYEHGPFGPLKSPGPPTPPKPTGPPPRASPAAADPAAHADPAGRAMLARLARGEASVGELAEPFAMSQPAISKHLKVLERAGLVSRGRDAQRRPCRLQAKPPDPA